MESLGWPKAKWWIPGVGLLISATLITAGFGWTIDRATHRYATEALVDDGIEGVSVDNSYRDVTLTGPASLENSAVVAVEEARLVKDVVYIASEPPQPSPSPSVSPEPTPEPELSPSPSPTDVTCTAITPECMGGVGYLEAILRDISAITFAYDSATVTPSGQATLEDLARAVVASLAVDPTIKVEVSGHTDSQASVPFNQRLSETRASVVRDYLVSRGVPTESLVIVGYGELQPIATNDTAEGRAANRRVEFTIVEG